MSIFNSFFRSRGLNSLNGLSDSQLSDIGISRDDLRQASRMGSRAGSFLTQRRAAHASSNGF